MIKTKEQQVRHGISESLTGRVVSVTGGSSGIGRNVARMAKAACAELIIVGRSQNPLDAAADEFGRAQNRGTSPRPPCSSWLTVTRPARFSMSTVADTWSEST